MSFGACGFGLGCRCLGFRAWGLGWWVLGVVCGSLGLGSCVWGLGVWRIGFGVSGLDLCVCFFVLCFIFFRVGCGQGAEVSWN